MKLDRKLAEWQRAGLVDEATAARILAHEAGAARPYLLYAVGGLGALSVGIGLLSIVAANWGAIPAGIKLALDLALLVGLAAAVYRAERKSWIAEIWIFVFYGAVLASIGLVAQVYHLGGKVEDALIVWSIITAPVVLHGSGRVLAAVWFVAVQIAWLSRVIELVDSGVSRSARHLVTLTTCWLFCLALIAAGTWGAFQRRKPEFASVARTLGAIELVALGTVAPLFWYGSSRYYEDGPLVGLGLACMAGVTAAAVGLSTRGDTVPAAGRGGARALVIVAVVGSYLPLLFAYGSAGWAAAASFLLLWSIVGFTAYRTQHYRLLNVATAFLGVRLLFIYFEVFGSLLDTGIGLLSGGVLTLLLAWVWVKKSRQWSRAAAPANPGSSDAQPS